MLENHYKRKLNEKILVFLGEPANKPESTWGRSTSGQSISMDWVIQQIAKDINNA